MRKINSSQVSELEREIVKQVSRLIDYPQKLDCKSLLNFAIVSQPLSAPLYTTLRVFRDILLKNRKRVNNKF